MGSGLRKKTETGEGQKARKFEGAWEETSWRVDSWRIEDFLEIAKKK